jgi:hypothetical protein
MFYMVATAFSVGAALITPIETRLPTPYKTMRECAHDFETQAARYENVKFTLTCEYIEERIA